MAIIYACDRTNQILGLAGNISPILGLDFCSLSHSYLDPFDATRVELATNPISVALEHTFDTVQDYQHEHEQRVSQYGHDSNASMIHYYQEPSSMFPSPEPQLQCMETQSINE